MRACSFDRGPQDLPGRRSSTGSNEAAQPASRKQAAVAPSFVAREPSESGYRTCQSRPSTHPLTPPMHERVQSDEFQRGATAHIASLPKVELHVHLEGSMRAATVVELATKSGTEIPRSLADGRWAFVDFADFMSQYSGACRTLSRREHFFRIATEFVEDAAAANVRYVEVTFTPEGHASRLGSWQWPLESVLDGLSEGRQSAWSPCSGDP